VTSVESIADGSLSIPQATVVAESSDRENRQERVRLIGQFAVEFRERALDANGVAWLDEINDEIGAIAD
jgi:hypothetical protein